MRLDAEQLLELLAFEEEWDGMLGGPGTRIYREIVAYCIGRMVACGATLENVLAYMQACATRWMPAMPAPPPGGATS